MFPDFQQYPPTMESVLEWLSDSSVHPRNKVNSFQWFHIPTLLTTHIQSQQEQQNNELLSQLLQRMMTILDECFDCHTPIPNKRLLHSSLSQLSQSPSLDPKISRKTGQCLTSLDTIKEGPFVLVSVETLESIETLMIDNDELQGTLSEAKGRNAQLEKEMKDVLEREESHLSEIESLQREMEHMQDENDELQSELERSSPWSLQAQTRAPQHSEYLEVGWPI
ncbi:hypothetical protein BLNAU_14487 [Blattamonas nauphoetae]|uniref:Uncharacterized protein n=1 Tax=Blattamonas nauphoetae TaxID=2049346 RepID=A0ABQ9XHA6_9EUKA|nr:hypothetical protein BLNAU_14487 [Blattamonas nauphoetae]